MPFLRVRRYLYALYRGQPALVRRQAEFSLLVWALLAGILVARLTIRLTLGGPSWDIGLRSAGYAVLLAAGLWLLFHGRLTAHVDVLAAICVIQCALLFSAELSRQFFSLSLFSMMAFAVLASRPHQKAIAFGLFPALTAAKGLYDLMRIPATVPFSTSLEDTVLTLLIAAASVPSVLFLIDVVGRESRRSETLRGENRTLKHEVGVDKLTGAWTRRQFDKLWNREQSLAARSGTPLAVAVIDLDRFKRVNDRWGHLTGDQVLALTAEAVLRVLRQGDSLVRWGGDEFVALCPGAGHDVALSLGAKLVAAVREDPKLQAWKQRISVGIAVWKPGETAPALLERADHMLYQAKNNGRSRVCAAGDGRHSCSDPDG